jgi:hypothetical protein
MKAGLGYLVIGAALLVVGLVVAGISTFSVTQVLQGRPGKSPKACHNNFAQILKAPAIQT